MIKKLNIPYVRGRFAELFVYSEFAGTLLGFDDYVSTSLLLSPSFTRYPLTKSALRYGARGCDRVVGFSLCPASDPQSLGSSYYMQ